MRPSRELEIASVVARPLDVPMRKPFGIAGGAQEVARNVLVELELAGGARGYGEAAPLPAFDGETQSRALAACEAAAPHLLGADVRRYRPLAALVAERARDGEGHLVGSAVCALETAVFDALCRALGIPLHALFGGAADSVTTDVTITTGTVEEARAEAAAFAEFDVLKIKVGGRDDHDVDLDVRRVLAVAEARPDAAILLDANGGLDAGGAIHLARELRRRDVRVALFEQPVSPRTCGGAREALEALARVRREIDLPVALDEMVRSPADARAAYDAGAADAVNVKITKSGVVGVLEIVAAARALGLRTMIGGMVETRLAMGTSAAIAAGLGGFVWIDLDTPLFLAEDPFDGGYAQRGPRLDLAAVAHGHGCTPRGAGACAWF